MEINLEKDQSSKLSLNDSGLTHQADQSQFITVKKNSKEAKDLLMGFSPNGLVATPLMNLGLGVTLSDDMTFMLRKSESILRPNKFKIFQKMGRLELLPLSQAPVLASLCLTGAFVEYKILSFMMLISLVFLHVGVFSLNDFFGHMDGSDWMNEKGGSRVIQNGWMTAGQVLYSAVGFLVGAAICSLPLFFKNPQTLVVALAGLLVVVGAQRRKEFSRRLWFAKELGLFLCLGPLLTASVEYVVFDRVTVQNLVLGLAFGFLSGLYVQIRHLISIYVDSELKIFTSAVRFGFDRARNLLLVSIGISCAAVLGVFVSGPGLLFSGLLATLVDAGVVFSMNKKIVLGIFILGWLFAGSFWIANCLSLGNSVKKMKSSFSSIAVSVQADIYRVILLGAMLLVFSAICFHLATEVL